MCLSCGYWHGVFLAPCYDSSADERTLTIRISQGLYDITEFLPERDYVTFGSLLSQFRLSSVCLSVCLSVTLVHPTQGVEAFGKISSPLCTLAIL